jgi:hypothetical protein
MVDTINGEMLSSKGGNNLEDAQQMRPWARHAKMRIVCASEVKTGRPLDGNVLKKISGDDRVQFRLMGQNEETTELEFNLELFANELPDIEPKFDEATSLRAEVYPYEKQYVDNPEPGNDKQLQKIDPHVLKAEFKTAKFKQHFLAVFVVEYRRTQLLRLSGFRRKVPRVMIEAKAKCAPSTRPLIDAILEAFKITGDPDDFVPDDVIRADVLSLHNIKNMTPVRDALAAHKKKHNLLNLNVETQKRINSRATRGIRGIITMREHDLRAEAEDESERPEKRMKF